MDIHEFLDSSKIALADNRHRALTHTLWFVKNVVQRVFGDYFVVPTTPEGEQIAAEIAELERLIAEKREDMRARKLGRVVATAQIGEEHILEDFGGKFMPTVQDYLQELPFQEWMNNGMRGHPPSYNQIAASRKSVNIRLD